MWRWSLNGVTAPLITAMVLTFNEEENIARALESLRWVDKILVIDSGSTDRTLEIVQHFDNAKIYFRAFTTFAEQCNFGLTLVDTPWVISIDADYVFPVQAEKVIRNAIVATSASGFSLPFRYAIYGKVVRGSILPPRTVLYRKTQAHYLDDGHGHRVMVAGDVENMAFNIIHDDRKPLKRWLESQTKYAAIEAEKLLTMPSAQLQLPDKIRKCIVLAPVLVFLLVYVFRGGFLSGWHGLFYALQRFYAELLLAINIVDRKIRAGCQK